MFDNLLNRLSPLATIYNSLVVLKSAFQQFEITQYSYDAFQTEQVQETYNYNPYSGVDQDTLITNDTEDDFTVVDKLTEDVDDDDYCHFAIGKLSSSATTNIPSVDNAYFSVVNGAYNLASVLAENLAHTFICGAVLSCNFIWTERKSLQDFVQEKSEKIANAPIVRSVSAPTQPKMRGFGADFGHDIPGIKFGLSTSTGNHQSHHVATNKHYANDVKPKKINVAANIRFAQEQFGITPSRKTARCNQVSFHDIDDWGLVERNYTVDSNASCHL